MGDFDECVSPDGLRAATPVQHPSLAVDDENRRGIPSSQHTGVMHLAFSVRTIHSGVCGTPVSVDARSESEAQRNRGKAFMSVVQRGRTEMGEHDGTHRIPIRIGSCAE